MADVEDSHKRQSITQGQLTNNSNYTSSLQLSRSNQISSPNMASSPNTAIIEEIKQPQ